jgi:glucose-6-phosphate 1-dehydrogenase
MDQDNTVDVFDGEGALVQPDLCRRQNAPDPCLIVLFGASGDLVYRKLVPALYNLFVNGGLPETYCILGAARTPMSEDAFRDKMRLGVAQAGFDLTNWSQFAGRLHYQQVVYDDHSSYRVLGVRLVELDRQHGTRGCRIFNLAIPPSLYGVVARELGRVGLAKEDRDKGRWTRLVVEKPFGYDLPSAQELNRAISEGFEEHQVFRIDHYMTKETVQNILIFRFANAIFEPLWNRNYIDHVRINASESVGVEHRAGYYDKAGVLRDMFQNHMMQLLSLVAAEPPSLFEGNRLRDKKAELFSSVKPLPTENLQDHLVLGQYTTGEVDGKPVPGYREEPGVDPESLTPTYALMRVFVANWRWQGVPFYITSGKRLKRKLTRIDIQFKPVPHSMFRQVLGEDIQANRLILGIHPEESIFLNFQAKRPGTRLCLRTTGLQFSYRGGWKGPRFDAYEKALIDTMAGDQTLFWRQDGLELCWAFLNPILQGCESCQDRSDRLHFYPAGSQGPQSALDLLPPGSWPEKRH